MQIKLISYSENKLVSMNAAHEIISNKIKEATGIAEEFLYCTTQKEMFNGVKQGIEEANIILIAVDVSKFISTKAALFRAMGFKCRLNAEIIELITSDACMATLNEKQINAHAAIPVGGEAFATADGLFSGLGIQSGHQKLIFVPIDEKRILSIIENGMISFISKNAQEDFAEPLQEKENDEDEVKEEIQQEDVENDIPAEMEGYVEPIDDLSVTTPDVNPDYVDVYSAAPSHDEVIEGSSAEEEYENIESSSYNIDDGIASAEDTSDKSEIVKNLEKITSRGIKIAFARQTENIAYTKLLSEAENVIGLEFVDFDLDKTLTEDIRRKESVASNARKAMKQTEAIFAVSMSELCYAQDNTGYIFVTLADAQKSSVYKIFAADGETEEDLYRIGFESVLEKMEEALKVVNSRPIQAIQNAQQQESKKKISSSTLIVIWVLIIIAVGALTVLVLDIVMTNNSASLTISTSAMIKEITNLLPR